MAIDDLTPQTALKQLVLSAEHFDHRVIGDVKGKTAVIVDDLIDTAGTLKAAADTVRDEGATRVYAAATHPVFSGDAYENLIAADFEQIVVTDTIPLRDGAPDNIKVLSCAELLTD
ncbi:MAG TPA: phosphoribosyltransferase family protein, partial [Vicinamibacterales bacterium]|nr:phosphoribosyltransferase family protein [Vicinamibacterales bacterium]